MNISPRSSMTIGQMAQLYNGNPNVDPSQVASNIFLGSSQGTDYLNQQGDNLGIGDPATYFQQARDAQRAANTPNGATMEAMRLAGQYSPQSLPGQLAAHQAMIGGVQAQQAQQSQVAGLQYQQTLNQQYPLPTPGVAPTLSPVMQAAMQQQGIQDPTAFIMQQRLGNNRSSVIPFSSVPNGQVKQDDLYHEPTFQANMAANPAKASQIFGALTGGDLASYHSNYFKSQADEQKFRDDTLRSELASGGATTDDQGNVTFSQKVFDPVQNKMVPNGKFSPGTPYQKIIAQSAPRVAPEIARFQQLAAKGGPTTPSNAVGVTSLQDVAPEQLQTGSGQGGVFGNTVTGALSDVSRIFQGQAPNLVSPALGQNNTGDFFKPTGSAVQHAAPILRNNPQFQALMKKDPAKARAVIMAIQMGNNSPQEPDLDNFGNDY